MDNCIHTYICKYPVIYAHYVFLGNSDTLFHKVMLTDLILQQIYLYICDTDSAINNLLNVCQKFRIIKKENNYFKLNKKYSRKYYSDATYKSKLDSLVGCGKEQLSLSLY